MDIQDLIKTEFEGIYIDENGNVYSTKANKGHTLIKRKPQKTNSGYYIVIINKKAIYVHRLVAQTLIPNPENKPQVNHINMDKSDNRASNLEWVTQKENMNHLKNNSCGSGKTKSNSGYLYEKTNKIKHFRSLQQAKEYCHKEYDCTLSTEGEKNVNWNKKLVYIRDNMSTNFDIKKFWEDRDKEKTSHETELIKRIKKEKGKPGTLYKNGIKIREYASIREAESEIKKSLKKKTNIEYKSGIYTYILKNK